MPPIQNHCPVTCTWDPPVISFLPPFFPFPGSSPWSGCWELAAHSGHCSMASFSPFPIQSLSLYPQPPLCISPRRLPCSLYQHLACSLSLPMTSSELHSPLRQHLACCSLSLLVASSTSHPHGRQPSSTSPAARTRPFSSFMARAQWDLGARASMGAVSVVASGSPVSRRLAVPPRSMGPQPAAPSPFPLPREHHDEPTRAKSHGHWPGRVGEEQGTRDGGRR